MADVPGDDLMGPVAGRNRPGRHKSLDRQFAVRSRKMGYGRSLHRDPLDASPPVDLRRRLGSVLGGVAEEARLDRELGRLA